MDWSEKISTVMRVLNVTQMDIADAAGMSQAYVSMLLSGKSQNPSLMFLRGLGKLGVNGDWLVNDRGDITASSPTVKNYLISAENDIVDICSELSKKGYNNLLAEVVSDNNMLPTFLRGDIAIYSSGLIDCDGIYAINEGGSISIRRLQFLRQEDAVLIISDNVQYQPRRLPLSKIRDYLTIEGRVVCRVLFE